MFKKQYRLVEMTEEEFERFMNAMARARSSDEFVMSQIPNKGEPWKKIQDEKFKCSKLMINLEERFRTAKRVNK